VLGRTLRNCLWLVPLLSLTNSSLRAKNASAPVAAVTVSVYNDAGVSAPALAQAEQAASWIFHQAGLEVIWANCEKLPEAPANPESCRQAVFPTHLQLRILRRSRGLTESTFGISYLSADGIGCYSDIFLEPIQRLQSHQNHQVSLGIVLGNVAAHEIGHLLLGTNSHSVSGIMRAHWYDEELASASRRALLFTPAQTHSIRERLAGGLAESKRASVAPLRQPDFDRASLRRPLGYVIPSGATR
jgi:hypothetical protein